jgi:enamine deaminase RidA (YjgF/YER057c/UK114 family)
MKSPLPILRTVRHPGWTERQITFPLTPSGDPRLNHQLEQYCSLSIEMAHLDWFGGPVDAVEAGHRLQQNNNQSFGTLVVGDDNSMPSWSQVRMISGTSLNPVYDNGRLIGRVFENADAVYLMLGGITPANLAQSKGDQTTEVFSIIQRALQRVGMEFRHVVRTWFYLDDILGWYDEFNHARSAFFKTIELGLMPASTGVGASNPSGAAVCAKVIAIMPKNDLISIKKAPSPLQGEALSYGSAFSRALEVSDATSKTLFISGTASIDAGGNTVHVGDTARQIETTMEVVNGMLNHAGMTLDDMTRGVVYFRNGSDLPLWSAYCEQHDLGDLPLAVTQSVVCREDLLFEIELDATKKTG